ncbi:MAG: hypothetical protein JWO67_1067 [Streptosporangiaceae bacterium]|nr:hypothetical protein [Streptosporangiaceae bacterium]
MKDLRDQIARRLDDDFRHRHGGISPIVQVAHRQLADTAAAIVKPDLDRMWGVANDAVNMLLSIATLGLHDDRRIELRQKALQLHTALNQPADTTGDTL